VRLLAKSPQGPAGALAHGEMDAIIPFNAITSLMFVAGGVAVAVWSPSIPACRWHHSANPDGSDRFVEDNAGDNDMELISGCQTLGAVQRGTLVLSRRDVSAMCAYSSRSRFFVYWNRRRYGWQDCSAGARVP